MSTNQFNNGATDGQVTTTRRAFLTQAALSAVALALPAALAAAEEQELLRYGRHALNLGRRTRRKLRLKGQPTARDLHAVVASFQGRLRIDHVPDLLRGYMRHSGTERSYAALPDPENVEMLAWAVAMRAKVELDGHGGLTVGELSKNKEVAVRQLEAHGRWSMMTGDVMQRAFLAGLNGGEEFPLA